MSVLVLKGSLTGKLVTYVAFTFGLAYLIDLIAYYIKFNVLLFQVSASVRMYTPFAAVVIIALIHTSSVRDTLRAYGLRFRDLRVKHVITALLIPLGMYSLGVLYAASLGYIVVNPAIPLAISGALPTTLHPTILFIILILKSLLAGATINTVFAIGEEIGWRSFMQVELGKYLGTALTPLAVGIAWELWHAPLILLFGYNHPHHRNLNGVLTFVLLCTIWSYILYIIRYWCGSVIAASIAHGTINGLASVSALTVIVKDELLGMPIGFLSILASLTILAIMLTLHYKAYKSRVSIDEVLGGGDAEKRT